MPLNTLLTTQEVILNRFLQLDPEALKYLKQLSGKVVKLELSSLSHFWLFKSDAIYMTKDYNGLVDLVISGSVFDFMQLALMNKKSVLTTIPIQVSGNMEFAEKFKDLFSKLEIDWEEQLSRLVGDTFAYPIVQFLKTLSQWGKQSVENLCDNFTNYFQAELDCLVPNDEVQFFFSDIDELRDDLARVEVRIERLQFKTQ